MTPDLYAKYLSQALRGHSKTNEKSNTAPVWCLLKGCPFLPWNGIEAVTQSSQISNRSTTRTVSHFIDDYLTKTYFGHCAFTLVNKDTWWYYFDVHDDLTSNTAESLNFEVNYCFTAGKK